MITRACPGVVVLALAALALGACAGPGASRPSPAQRRQALLDDSPRLGAVVAALADEDVVVRRTAARLLAMRGAEAEPALLVALTNSDILVRRTGLLGLCRLGGEPARMGIEKALDDSSALLRLAAVEHLAAVRPRTETVLAQLAILCDDDDAKVRAIATRATWPFAREAPSIRDGGTDRDIVVGEAIALSVDGWRFRLDPQREGHRRGWFSPDHDDGDWDVIAIEQVWQQAGYEYTGVAWYRRTIELPAQPEHLAVDLSFGGVDESAWVWVNGQYAGDHDIGPAGWNVPFRLDVTALLEWDRPNQITVRAMNTVFGGGVWKPVTLEVLR